MKILGRVDGKPVYLLSEKLAFLDNDIMASKVQAEHIKKISKMLEKCI